MAEAIGDIARRAGDSAEHTGNHPSHLMSKARLAKRGDVTCRLAGTGNLAIVLEAMDRGKSRLTRAVVNRELEEAKINRGASFATAVVPAADNALMCFQAFQDLGEEKWAVVLPREAKEKNVTLALEFVYHLARQRAVAAEKQSGSFDVAFVGQLTEEIKEKLGICNQIKQHMNNGAKSHEEATMLLSRLERKIRDHLRLLLDSLRGRNGSEEAGE